jgi:hypothetical protein
MNENGKAKSNVVADFLCRVPSSNITQKGDDSIDAVVVENASGLQAIKAKYIDQQAWLMNCRSGSP